MCNISHQAGRPLLLLQLSAWSCCNETTMWKGRTARDKVILQIEISRLTVLPPCQPLFVTNPFKCDQNWCNPSVQISLYQLRPHRTSSRLQAVRCWKSLTCRQSTQSEKKNVCYALQMLLIIAYFDRQFMQFQYQSDTGCLTVQNKYMTDVISKT